MSQALRTFLKHQTALKRFLARLLPSPQDVDDIAQEAFLRAFAAEASQDVLAPKAFLFRVAKNLALNERSRMWNTTTTRVGDSSELDVLVSSDDVSGEDRIHGRRKLALFAEAVSDLPPQCRRVFLLRKVHELSHKEIAARMRISVSTVEKHVATGLLRCSEYLSQRGYEVGESGMSAPARTVEPVGRELQAPGRASVKRARDG